jgi:two-component system NtrC family sensor kinase
MFLLFKIASQRNRTLQLMVLGVLAVVCAGIWDARQQSERGLGELVHEHRLLALSLSALSDERLTETARLLEQNGDLAVLLRKPNGGGFVLSNGKVLHSAELDEAFAREAPGCLVPRSLASTIGLAPRSAVAGIASREGVGQASAEGVAVIESAAPERDRAVHAEWRAVLMVFVVSLLIIGFGIIALGRQRRESVLTQQIQLHRAERARDVELSRANRMATIAALASGFAHEISTPLGVIVGRVEQLRAATSSDDKATRALDAIAAQTDRVDRVIRGFLGLARGDAPVLKRVPAAVLAREASDLVQHRFAHAHVELRVDAPEDASSFVACDATLFGQVLVNALINALEASEANDAVRLQVSRAEEWVEFSIVDQGYGIPRATIEQVTEPFFTTKATRGGTGLGLAIAREIVVHHRGRLTLARRADQEGAAVRGTRVTVQLPAA